MRRLPSLPQIAGNLAMPGFTAPKLLWVARARAGHLRAASASVLLPKDWLRWRLTGHSRQRHVRRRRHAVARCRPARLVAGAAAGQRHDAGADAARSSKAPTSSGTLQRDAAAALGLPAGLPVAGGGGDNAASAVGIGAVQPGEGFLSLGTSGVLFVVTDRYRPNPASAVHAFCHALPGRWHQMSVMLSAANGLQMGHAAGRRASEAALLARARRWPMPHRDRAPLFLPYLSGERTPHNDPHATGVFFGLDNETDAARLGHAVHRRRRASALADGLEALRDAGTAGATASAGGRRLAQRALGAAARRHAGHRADDRGRRRSRRRAGRGPPGAGWRSAATSADRLPAARATRTSSGRDAARRAALGRATTASARSIAARAT